MNRRYRDPEAGFWAKVQKSEGCWEWVASKNAKGRGTFRGQLAPRVAWRLCVGPIPDGLCVCHTCDNPGCVNPAHLFLGTHTDNMHDCIRKGRHVNFVRSGNPKLSDDQVAELRRLGDGGASVTWLMAKFGIGNTQVRRLLRREQRSDGLRVRAQPKRNPFYKIVAPLVRAEHKLGDVKQQDIARKYGISDASVSRILSGAVWANA